MSASPKLVSHKSPATYPILSPDPEVIKTPRLLLRPFLESDLNAYHALRSDPEVMFFSSTHNPDPDIEYTRTKLLPFLSTQKNKKGSETYSFAVEELSNPGTLIGDCGAHIASPGEEEIGYSFAKSCWGKGYATEALAAFVEHWWRLKRENREVDEETETEGAKERLMAVCEPENIGSLRVLEKCGFKETRRFIFEGNGDALVEFLLEEPGTASLEGHDFHLRGHTDMALERAP